VGRTETRGALLAAAMELFGERGFTGTTVDEIVERAGVAKGTIYYHFKSKADVAEALIVEHLEPLAARLNEAVASAHSPGAQMEAIVAAELEFVRDDNAFAKLLLNELWREDRVWRETFDLLWDNAISIVASVIDAGVASGEFAEETDVRLTAAAVFGMVAVVGLTWHMARPDRAIEDVTLHAQRLAVNSLR